ncbi:DoxX family membrane protein [Herbiconiux sp. L3-i23]|uniref:DoxX family protein n=1 Tax=Herbiconiux sp. L3-i23 TaxID=2905871 RepID=UPI00204A57AC|nr:DoxX family membrane protein [Herbiconiux sp. L3-i23]BDI21766.1 hypothetical protein L3i23_05420 [Herbiconiux sp. L3-i23]
MSAVEIVQWGIRIALAAAFIGMGVNHFRPGPRRVMAKMIPPALRGSAPETAMRLVLFTGVCEIAGGIGVLLPPVAPLAATLLVVFLVAVFPANAYAATRPETFGRLAFPFWPRYAGQLVLVLLLAVAALVPASAFAPVA